MKIFFFIDLILFPRILYLTNFKHNFYYNLYNFFKNIFIYKFLFINFIIKQYFDQII